MKNLISCSLCILLVGISFQVMAQRGPRGPMDPEQMASRQTEQMKASLELSEEQAVKVSEINLKFATQIQEIRQANEGDFAAMREALPPLREERDTALKAVLTETQWASFEKMMEENRRNRQGPGRRRPAQPTDP